MKIFNFFSFPIALFCIFILACSVPLQRGDKDHQRIAPKPAELAIRKIVLVPFTSSTELTPGTEQYLTYIMYNELISKIANINIVPLESSTTEFSRLKAEIPDLPDRELAVKVGNNLGAQAVLIGNINTYRERKGGELGVSSPASVAFSVELLNTSSGEKIWENYFVETQKPLLENVAEIGKFIKRKGKWISVDELAKEGVAEVVETLIKFLEQR